MKITACWIAKNEEKNLPRSIRSVSRLTDELIVVDTGSTDGTVEAAKELKAKIYDFEWINDFAAARNYALSKASGDIIIFLDADEWFYPALARKDRQTIEKIFANPNVDCIRVKETDVNEDTNQIISIDDNIRIYRRQPDMHYVGSIHETIRRKTKNGYTSLRSYTHHSWNFNHSGYSTGILNDKLKRNIAMLESILDHTDDPFDLFIFHTYLLREYHSSAQYESALAHLQYLLDHAEHFDAAYRIYKQSFMNQLLKIFYLCQLFRSRIDKKQIYSAVVLPLQKHFSSVEYKVIGLHYQYIFECRLKDYLTEFSAVLPSLPKPTKEINSYYQRFITEIKHYAASLYLGLGNYEMTFNLLNDVFQNKSYYSPNAIVLLMDCLYGQPDDTVIQYLLSVLDFNRAETYSLLSELFIRIGRKKAFLYFQKKQLDAGILSKPEMLFLFLISNNYNQFDAQILSINVGEEKQDLLDEVNRQLFFACILTNQQEYYLHHKERLHRYERVLESYYADIPLADITVEELLILSDSYHILAFSRGMGVAEKFIRIFSANPTACFYTKIRYYSDNHLDQELFLLDREDVRIAQEGSNFVYLCKSLVRYGKHIECLSILEGLLRNGLYDDWILQQLFFLSENGQEGLAERAKSLYDEYFPLYEKQLDTQNID